MRGTVSRRFPAEKQDSKPSWVYPFQKPHTGQAVEAVGQANNRTAPFSNRQPAEASRTREDRACGRSSRGLGRRLGRGCSGPRRGRPPAETQRGQLQGREFKRRLHDALPFPGPFELLLHRSQARAALGRERRGRGGCGSRSSSGSCERGACRRAVNPGCGSQSPGSGPHTRRPAPSQPIGTQGRGTASTVQIAPWGRGTFLVKNHGHRGQHTLSGGSRCATLWMAAPGSPGELRA